MIVFNTMFKNEEKLLNQTLKIWKRYPIDLFIFYDDNSTDDSVKIIKDNLEEFRYIIVNDKLPKFNESYQRQKMINVSRDMEADIIFSIDCDELLTSNILTDWNKFLSTYETTDMFLYWYNSVNSLSEYRTDPQYINNYRSFVLPVKYMGNLNTNDWKYHTPRTPHINLPKTYTKDYGVIHLQSINRKFFAIKQLWYKHHEFVYYGHSVEFINNRYDPVVNNLDFNPVKIPENLIQGIEFDIEIFNESEKEKNYLKFIRENYNPDLITFGKEYL